MVAKEAISVVFNYVENNPSMGITVADKIMVEAEDNDIYSAVEKGITYLYIDRGTYFLCDIIPSP